MDLSRLLKRTLVVLAVVAAIVAIPSRYAYVGIQERYSRDWNAASSADAEARGILQARPVITPATVQYLGDSLSFVDAWVEQVTRIEYPWYLFRREVKEPRYRLVLQASNDWKPNFRCNERLVHSDSIGLSMSQSDVTEFYSVRTEPSFPDTIQLGIEKHGEC